MFTIGKLAEKTGLTPDTLRYYEKEGLFRPVEWSEIGYRLYDAETIRRIRLIRQAQDCGFSLAEIRELLFLQQEDSHRSGEIRKRVREKKEELEKRILTMQAMVRTLDRMDGLCCEESLPVGDCPILIAFQDEIVRPEIPREDRPTQKFGQLQKGKFFPKFKEGTRSSTERTEKRGYPVDDDPEISRPKG
ncbi:MAG: heavy metal-responsive transcriptional regulator [Nitrospiraceae bacterium]|nr:heavy metal-responsive transcriptional regulator [Nitrospiraceae bacterium]